MLEVLEFIFQDFWHWLGAFLMLGLIASIPIGLINITFKKKDKKDS